LNYGVFVGRAITDVGNIAVCQFFVSVPDVFVVDYYIYRPSIMWCDVSTGCDELLMHRLLQELIVVTVGDLSFAATARFHPKCSLKQYRVAFIY